MERLRATDGCPWDREQTFASIAPYTIEEAYEVADAIERGRSCASPRMSSATFCSRWCSMRKWRREQGAFDFEAVAGSICDKLVRRHPHVFDVPAPGAGPLTAQQQLVAWEDIKARERAAESARPLDGVPRALPALMRAYKLSKRAARVGFDFEHRSQTADKVEEELAEVREAADNSRAAGNHADAPSQETFEEVGDLLFAAANLARKLGVDAESALRAANVKFERRFRAMEELAKSRGLEFSSLNLDAQESLWLERQTCGMSRPQCPPAGPGAAAPQVPPRPSSRWSSSTTPTCRYPRAALQIQEALRRHQVLIVAGDTGSGKSTQLPQICLELGRGRGGPIAHTQPRRIAARALASRIAEELAAAAGRPPWDSAVRFADRALRGDAPGADDGRLAAGRAHLRSAAAPLRHRDRRRGARALAQRRSVCSGC